MPSRHNFVPSFPNTGVRTQQNGTKYILFGDIKVLTSFGMRAGVYKIIINHQAYHVAQEATKRIPQFSFLYTKPPNLFQKTRWIFTLCTKWQVQTDDTGSQNEIILPTCQTRRSPNTFPVHLFLSSVFINRFCVPLPSIHCTVHNAGFVILKKNCTLVFLCLRL